MLLSLTSGALISLLLGHLATALPSWPSSSTQKYWHGWSNVKYLFVFGDSYTTVGFNATTGPQPSTANPIGNPPYPGYTSSNGPNWVDFLTTTYNESLILTYDLGFGGATIDASIIPGTATAVSMKSQVEQEYLPIYADRPSFAPWNAGDSLFAFFIGINDVGNGYKNADYAQLYDEDWAEYAVVTDQVYHSGARNFLFLNVPPVDRSPLTVEQGTVNEAKEKAAISAWNARLISFANNLTTTYRDVTAFVFDTNAVFTRILNNPDSYSQTADLRNVTGYCFAYENGTSATDTYIPGCLYPVDEYFWLNVLHPTYRVHNATASQIVKQLGGSGYAHDEPWGWGQNAGHPVQGTWTPWGVRHGGGGW